MRLTVLSRASDLARIQAETVARALQGAWPDVQISTATRAAAGDRDESTPLAALTDKGAFTADLSDQLAAGAADLVVHSWKDLPLEARPDTTIAATCPRADPRDVLLLRVEAVEARVPFLDVLTSSPRRAWLLESSVQTLLPWPVERIRPRPVRGNVPTRLRKLLSGDGHGLLVAKAALDRLLDPGHRFSEAREAVRSALDRCRFMVLPISRWPTAPAQGALAVEVSTRRRDLVERLDVIDDRATRRTVAAEREVLAAYGGGCHLALGATCVSREFGDLLSIRGRRPDGGEESSWTLTTAQPKPPRAPVHALWPRPDERGGGTRQPLAVEMPAGNAGLWITRAEALPAEWPISPDRLVWAAGLTTWERIAARGVWVNGCADGLGDAEPPGLEHLAGAGGRWHRLTHTGAGVPDAIATYAVEEPLPDDLGDRSHFFWTSGTQFRRAIERWPSIRDRWHGTGPGRTRRVVEQSLGGRGRAGVWLDIDTWYQEVRQ